MKDLSNYKHFVGCDVSKNTLDFAIYERGKDFRQFEHLQVTNNLAGFQAMRKWLRGFDIKMKDVVVGMEHTGSYTSAITDWCYKKGYAFVLLHPLDVKNACSRGRNKNDTADSQFIADYVYMMREKLSVSEPEPQIIRKLRQLRNERQLAVRTRTAYINQLKSLTETTTAKRLEKMIAILTEQIKDVEKAMLKAIESEETLFNNYKLLRTIPGIGLVNAITTIIATGNFTRFQTSRQYAKFCCLSPLTRQSGVSVKGKDQVSRAGHNEIKAILTEGARSAIHHDKQLKEYYNRKRAAGKSHGCVMNAVKFKLVCRMFAVIQRQTPYVNTSRYMS